MLDVEPGHLLNMGVLQLLSHLYLQHRGECRHRQGSMGADGWSPALPHTWTHTHTHTHTHTLFTHPAAKGSSKHSPHHQWPCIVRSVESVFKTAEKEIYVGSG